ncbi:hypothetical protein BU15DRAFT_87408 [Melanogaster broomeanus]|nr:hypothetical protein BU15DRAFT_87408 [Melanogaster broomeanus]
MTPTPSAILNDALASFNKAATLAFTAAQEQARKDVIQATTDARDARRERDEAVNALHASRLAEQAWKQEAGVWKAAADQTELTINHHLETIDQLRQEATQWKNQCLRLEETSRQEAISWKEQFLRVEQERCKLAQRVEGLVAEQLSGAHGNISSTSYAPMVRYSAMGDLPASARLHRPSDFNSPSPGVEELPPSKTPFSKSRPSSTTRSRPVPIVQLPTPISENQRSARQRAAQESSSAPTSRTVATTNGERQILIRRVQAVVEIPVKEESVDRDAVEHASTSASGFASTSASVSVSVPASKASKAPIRTAEASKAATRVKRKAVAKRTYVEVDESEGDDNASEAPEQSSAESGQTSSDDDDELLMGVEANRKEVYGTNRISKQAAHPNTPSRPPASSGKKRRAAPPTKKRRPSATSRS